MILGKSNVIGYRYLLPSNLAPRLAILVKYVMKSTSYSAVQHQSQYPSSMSTPQQLALCLSSHSMLNVLDVGKALGYEHEQLGLILMLHIKCAESQFKPCIQCAVCKQWCFACLTGKQTKEVRGSPVRVTVRRLLSYLAFQPLKSLSSARAASAAAGSG